MSIQPGDISFDDREGGPSYPGYDLTPRPQQRGIPDEDYPEPVTTAADLTEAGDEAIELPPLPEPPPRREPAAPAAGQEPAAAQGADPDQLPPGKDAELPDLEAIWRAATAGHAQNVKVELGTVIREMAAMHGMYYEAWLAGPFSRKQAFKLVKILIRQQFSG